MPVLTTNETNLDSSQIDQITLAINKYKNHPSIRKILAKHDNIGSFKFSHITPDVVRTHILNLDAGKSSSSNIPLSILKKSVGVLMVPMTDCFNNCINDGFFQIF